MSGKPQIDGCRVVALGDAWAYGQGQITWNELEALAHAAPAEAHCATCSCVPGMTPAIRFDTTPAEHDGAVRDHLIRMGWTPPAEAQAQGGGEVVAWFPTNGAGEIVRNYGDGSPVYACKTKEQAEQVKRCHLGAAGPVIPLYAAPPSAPVGVEGLVADMRRWVRSAEAAGPYAAGRTVVVQEWANQLEALAQQPAAPRNSSGHCPDSSGHSRVESILLRAGFNPDEAARIAARAVRQGGAAR